MPSATYLKWPELVIVPFTEKPLEVVDHGTGEVQEWVVAVPEAGIGQQSGKVTYVKEGVLSRKEKKHFPYFPNSFVWTFERKKKKVYFMRDLHILIPVVHIDLQPLVASGV